MSTFPALKSGAIQQYPASRSLEFANQIQSFLDGTEQRYRSSASALHKWVIQLSLLDNAEIGSLDQFFWDQQGSFESFSFTDPWDGTVYPDCSLEADQFTSNFQEELRANTKLVIRENRI
ncbi:MAG: DUF2460 domain-containing protein [Bryobacteraceae bacterium]